MIESGETPPWRLSDERSFIENLLCTRFNFLLVFFSLVVAGALAASDPLHFKSVLVVGAVITIPFAGTIMRAQAKLDILLPEIFKDEKHPARFADDKCRGPSMRRWIGYWIPAICSLALLVGAILALFGVIAPHS